tara:strand:+ start:658 stop:1428 length:771 start_codon:yes stop_codon:yes gene_type:complete
MNKGWISVQRKIFDNIILKPKGKYTRMEAFMWLLKETSYSDQQVNIGNEIYNIKSGQILRSQEKLRKQFKWGNTKLRNFLKLLEKVGTIKVETNSKLTMITMLKFNDFQKKQTENKYQTNNKQIHSNKDINKVNKEPLSVRFEKFKEKCKNELPNEHPEYEAFVNWFSAYNEGGSKMHWEKQKTFNLKMRWATWIKKSKNPETKKQNLNNKFPYDATGNSRLGKCESCKSTVFLDKWNPVLDSPCCSGSKVIGKGD